MNLLSAIAYISISSATHSKSQLEALLVRARVFNSEVGVTDTLLLHDRTFFQYFEGPAQGVAQVYQRIQASSAYKNIIELLNQFVDQRVFFVWLMGFAEAQRPIIIQLEQAHWRTVARAKQGASGSSLGLGLLLEFSGNARSGLQ